MIYLQRNFTCSGSIILAKDLRKWKRVFAIILIDHHTDDTGSKIIAGM